MKASELQIGDWVTGKKWRENPFKLSRINDNGKYYYGITSDGTQVGPFFLEEIEHIPLTAEILEKNGFEKTQIHGEKQDDIFQCYDGEIIIEVGIYDPNFILIHYRYETPDGINSGELSSIVKVDGGKFYLHELQHALRLCKIDKTIEL